MSLTEHIIHSYNLSVVFRGFQIVRMRVKILEPVQLARTVVTFKVFISWKTIRAPHLFWIVFYYFVSSRTYEMAFNTVWFFSYGPQSRGRITIPFRITEARLTTECLSPLRKSWLFHFDGDDATKNLEHSLSQFRLQLIQLNRTTQRRHDDS